MIPLGERKIVDTFILVDGQLEKPKVHPGVAAASGQSLRLKMLFRSGSQR
jgi:hypothetical protein